MRSASSWSSSSGTAWWPARAFGGARPSRPDEYSLTAQADRYFPPGLRPRCSAPCCARSGITTGETPGVAEESFRTASPSGRSAKSRPQIEGKSTARERLEAIADNIRGSGVAVDVEEHDGTLVLREHNCPYANVVSEHPECCTVIHTMLDEVVSPAVKQTESLATGGAECRFEVGVEVPPQANVPGYRGFSRSFSTSSNIGPDSGRWMTPWRPASTSGLTPGAVTWRYTYYLKVGPGDVIEDISYFTTGCGFACSGAAATCSLLVETRLGRQG